MRKYNELLEKYALRPYRYQIKGKATLIDTESGRFVIKERNRNNNEKIYQYLNSRNFNYYPKKITDNLDDYEISEYIDNAPIPDDQKMFDMIELVGLLHNKTTHYKEVDEDDYKKIYEDINNNIYYLNSYYTDIITITESKVYMSPSEYLFARNSSKIFSALNFCKGQIEKWYELVKEKRKQRLVVLHNNLEINHFIRNNSSYLINWEKSKIDLPIFDFYKLYRKHALDYDFSELLKKYESNFPLLEDEKKLLFILMALPTKIEFDKPEYQMCKIISREIDIIYKTELIISPYYANNAKKQES